MSGQSSLERLLARELLAMTPAERDVTTLLQAIEHGDEQARAELFAVLYDELRARAAQLARGRPRQDTLRTTAIVHETYVRLARGRDAAWVDRAHFLATAARAMRHVLIDQARARKRRKREPSGWAVALEEVVDIYEERAVDLEQLDSALARLVEFDPEMAQAVELRFFGGASVEEAARILGMSKRTFERRWESTRAWLKKEIE
jgi:RNA polymerase sigma factor (TIGR02999 family)